ncbi:replication protein RepA [Acidisoma silvae]|uniref:Plasmid replication initiator n=1 Tax=Acidisoma silvae TaxID=2802396 RepID=A0A963YWI9_9PROT|nr:replication protein RepA [Acidisoma silvae]MCB8878512.1 plasmid replication initiator [Acidisoma silvae]
MGAIHDMLEKHGRQGTLDLPGLDKANYRQTLEAAYQFMSAEEQRTGFLYSGWCQTALPHRRLPDDKVWTLSTDHVKLMVEPGSVHTENNETRRVGVPYGSRARLILLFLQSEAVRTGNREIELGRSLRVWLGKMGIPIGGRSMADVREQALRISRCRMTFQIQSAGATGFINQNLVDTAMFNHEHDGPLLETVKLSETFFKELTQHPVPLQESAIRAIANNSQALDIYCWLAYRLHSLSAPRHITWKALYAQFGNSYKSIQNFRPRWIDSLTIALAVYPEAQVEWDKSGIVLCPGNPPVPPRALISAKSHGKNEAKRL